MVCASRSKRCFQSGRDANSGGRTLIATVRIQASIAAFVHLSHSTSADGLENFVWSKQAVHFLFSMEVQLTTTVIGSEAFFSSLALIRN
jgi:hypothetical protein